MSEGCIPPGCQKGVSHLGERKGYSHLGERRLFPPGCYQPGYHAGLSARVSCWVLSARVSCWVYNGEHAGYTTRSMLGVQRGACWVCTMVSMLGVYDGEHAGCTMVSMLCAKSSLLRRVFPVAKSPLSSGKQLKRSRKPATESTFAQGTVLPIPNCSEINS